MTVSQPNLFPGEAILYRTRLHGLVIVRHALAALTTGVILEVIFFILLFAATFLGARLPAALDINKLEWTSYVLALLPFLLAGLLGGLLDHARSELVLTNQRVLIKAGAIRRRAYEVNLSDERAFQIRQPFLSKPLGFRIFDLSDGHSFPFVDPQGLVQKREPPPAPKLTPPPEEKLRIGEVPRSQRAAFADIETPAERTQRLIRQASEQIKFGHLTEAKAIVRELLKLAPDNANVWYLAGHLSSSPKKKKQAFTRALSIDPDHRKARQALDLLGGS